MNTTTGLGDRPHIIAMTALLGLLILALGSGRLAAAPRVDGWIVFESDRGGQNDIWIMRPDGSSAANLTHDKSEDIFPQWSADGKKIAWTRGGFGPEGEIWVMNADGSGKTQLTFNVFSDYNVTWSPDGSRIAFRSFRDGNRDIYVMNADGTNEQRLTADPASDFAPDWSPDGARIAFTSLRSGDYAIYTMNTDGSDLRKLTPDGMHAALPGWSPDGSSILFGDGFCDTCGESDLFTMNPDGSAVTQVTDTPENELAKSWSRDGTRVVADFATLTPPGSHLSKGDVAVIDTRTGAVQNLTNTLGINEGHPDWSASGRPQIAAAAADAPVLQVEPRAASTRAPTLQARASTNPGLGQADVFYTLPRAGNVRLRLFDVAGRQIGCPVNGWQPAGAHTASFSSGPRSRVCFYRLEWEGSSASGKFSLAR